MTSSSVVYTAFSSILLCSIFWTNTHADSWGPPRAEHWSANKMWVLKVGWLDDSTLSLWERTDDGLKERWRRGYVDQVWPPHRAHVTNNGEFVVLRDIHHNLGYREVIAILGKDGNILGSYQLQEFLPLGEIRRAEHTVSSIWWSEHAWFSLIHDDRRFALVTQMGTVRCFDLPTGKLLDPSDDKRGEIVDLVRTDAEAWLKSEDFNFRIRGVTLLGAMRIKERTSSIEVLFHDRTPTGSVATKGKPGAVLHNVQTAAGLALVRLMGADAIPIIEEELGQANWYMREQMLGILNRLDAGGPDAVEPSELGDVLEMWKRLAKHSSHDIRHPALCQVLRRDATYLFDHPELIHSGSDQVRTAAVWVLAETESPAALRLLREAINGEQDAVWRLALRALIAKRPPDIETVLQPYLEDNDTWIRIDVICELVCRENVAAMERLWRTIESWPNAELDGHDNRSRRWEIQKLCMLIAARQLTEAREYLEGIRNVTACPTAVSVAGALAALGDDNALHDLHRMTSEGKARDRAIAIQMCRYLSDEKSATLVQQAADTQKGELQYAATRELPRFEDRRDTDNSAAQ